jgi:hypothetical protein
MRSSLIAILLVMVLSGCNLTQGSTPTPTPAPDLPQVEILEPANNRQIYEGTEFDFDIVARDDGAGIARIELSVDDTVIHSASPVDAESVPVFRVTMNWRAEGAGLHIVQAIAYRADGTPGDPALINIEVLTRP